MHFTAGKEILLQSRYPKYWWYKTMYPVQIRHMHTVDLSDIQKLYVSLFAKLFETFP